MEVLEQLDELIETMKLAAALGGIPLALMLLVRPSGVPTWRTRLLLAALAAFLLPIATGTGSCVLGGFIQGSAFCSLRHGGVTWDPAADFHAIQAVYSLLFLLTASFSGLAMLGLLPGRVTAWQRFKFLATAGRRGAWRETQPSLELYVQELQEAERRMDQLARGLRAILWLAAFVFGGLSLGFLFTVIIGALTQETIMVSRWSSGRAVSLAGEPALFWFTMAMSLTLSIVMGWIATGCVRSLLRPAAAPPGQAGASNRGSATESSRRS
jgi:hypothetical protein